MADITSSITIRKAVVGDLTFLTVETDATADNGDTFTVDLNKEGIGHLLSQEGYYQSTENSVIVASAFTTSVSAGVVTVTLDSAAGSNKKRVWNAVGRY